MPHSFWWLTVDALAVYRLVVLVVKDAITDPVRDWLGKPWSRPGQPFPAYSGGRWWTFKLVTCPWCVSVWLAAAVVFATRFMPGAWQYGAVLLALSGVAGFLAERG
jgi:hypothetical protein